MDLDFNLHDELLHLQEDSIENYHILNEVILIGRNRQELEVYLNDIVDKIEVSSDTIAEPLVFDKIRSFIKNFDNVRPKFIARLVDIVLSAFRQEIKATSADIEANEKETFATHKTVLEMYGFILHWFLLTMEEKSSSTSGKMKRSKSKAQDDDSSTWDWNPQKLRSFELMASLLELRIQKIWPLTPERDLLLSLFTKPAYQIFESSASIKNSGVKATVFNLLGITVTKYGQAFGAQTTIIQDLQYWEHSAEPMAEFLQVLVLNHDHRQLSDEVLRDISNKVFKDNTSKELKDSPNSKTFAAFLVRMSELCPKVVLKNMGLLIGQLDSESYTMRMAIVEVVGNLIIDMTTKPEENQNNLQINGFFDVLEDRMLDSVAFTRSKVLQIYLKILDLKKASFPKRRHTLGTIAIRHLEDKTSSVRRYAVRVLTKLIQTHPYTMYGGLLDMDEWKERYEELQNQLAAIQAPQELQEVSEETRLAEADDENEDTNGTVDDTHQPQTEVSEDVEMEEANNEEDKTVDESSEQNDGNPTASPPTPSPERANVPPSSIVSTDEYHRINLAVRFNADAIKFISQIQTAIPFICLLLASKSKVEVVESMDFFVTAWNYKIEASAEGIKRMPHLIWTKDNSDEGKGVKTKLLECYKSLYLEFDGNLSDKENINTIARNLVQLTFNTTLAELTSLEQLLCTLMSQNHIPEEVIDKLWAVYSYSKREIPKPQRRGAIIILGMLAKAKSEIVSEKIDVLLKVGLGSYGRADLPLAKYTCIALQRLGGSKENDKGKALHEGTRLPMDHAIFKKLKNMIEEPSTSPEWFAMAEQAINTIYGLGEHPEILCAEIIRMKTIETFGSGDLPLDTPMLDNNGELEGEDAMQVEYDVSVAHIAPPPQSAVYTESVKLSQLCSILGHVAIKHIVHMEIIEAAWKRKKRKADDTKARSAVEDELEQVGGTADDDIGDHMLFIREREILFGNDSLLAQYGPLLAEICTRNKVYTDPTLQVTATLALSKFMCVSSDFCESHLQLLFTILEKSKNPAIRSNLVIALGDMAVCFSTLIDENISFLYNRLSDDDTLVKKNALMVLTHLILNGMVKIKGQIAEMAKCLEDPEPRISDLAKLFFSELASKDNAIYNNLPDIISSLSNPETRIQEEPFRKIMKFLFSFDFAEKEKQAENVMDKLCLRYKNCDDERLWRDITFCLSLLPFKSEKSYRKLLEYMPLYQDKLHEEGVSKLFTEIIVKV
ncbi:hypothetical protein K450DRAFT_250238 [Umbelopsis ramanniana AG]|uniref:Condensin complex subunit 1 n=1 Tax=Umbelopsis ramanniana AG TaxID=1314678 RepID=A0AAD5HCS5_UMBRA|nr:uncharacterized protein K450DRAFT_250238 [Umbelopsis ramanniana AG]KAI8577831.1 hypothetical protein K450DRAFT_250238 [Umbelopsis ramanniana AG]